MKRRSFLRHTALGTAVLSSYSGYNRYFDSQLNNNGLSFNGKEEEDKPLLVAVVQQNGGPGEVEANRNKALSFASRALSMKADVILFHEELLIGYHKDSKKLAEPLNGTTTRAFQDLLKGSESLIIYGLTERDGDDYFISAPVVSAKGVIANYRKTHLWWNAEGLRHEPSFYKPGNRLVTFPVKGFMAGIVICYDGDFPEMTRSYANLGCSLLFWMNNRGSRGHEEVRDLAEDNSMIMPVSCCCGRNEIGDHCRGGSNITGPKGELIAELWDDEGIITGEVYPGRVSRMRKENPWFTGQRPDLYYYK